MESDVDRDGHLSLIEFRNYYEKISAKYKGEIYNRLLVSDRIGRVRRSTYNLPPLTFIYGKPSGSDIEGVGDCIIILLFIVLSSWETFDQKKDRVNENDYIPMNVNANDDGCVKAPEYRAHHLAHPIYKQYQEILPKSNKPTIPAKFRDSRFGQKGRPSTPIKMLIKNEFGGSQEERDYPKIPRRDEAKVVPRARQTKASLGRLHLTQEKLAPPEDTIKLWKMSKFRDVESKTASIYKTSTKNTLAITGSNALSKSPIHTKTVEIEPEQPEQDTEAPRMVEA